MSPGDLVIVHAGMPLERVDHHGTWWTQHRHLAIVIQHHRTTEGYMILMDGSQLMIAQEADIHPVLDSHWDRLMALLGS